MNRTTWLQDRRMQKFRDVLSRWEHKQLSVLEAAEILGVSERQFRRYRRRYEEQGLDGLIDRRLGKASVRRVPVDKIAWMIEQYRTHHMGWNVKHFHEHIRQQHAFRWGYTWTKTQLHTAGLVERAARRGAHRRKRPRKPCEGMMLHQDGSRFAWLADAPGLDLIVTMDDATSTIYSAFLVEEEGTASTFGALLEVFTAKGLPASLYTDRGSHYFFTPKAGEAVDKNQLTQVGRALDRLGIEHIAAYSPEARGRSERMFGTLQDRLPKAVLAAVKARPGNGGARGQPAAAAGLDRGCAWRRGAGAGRDGETALGPNKEIEQERIGVGRASTRLMNKPPGASTASNRGIDYT